MPDEPVSVVCPHCSVRMKLKDSSALGKTIKCPKCAKTFVAAAAGAVAATAGAPAKKKRAAATETPPDGDGDESAPEEPKKKKKKKKKKKASGAPLPLILGICAFVLLLVAGGVVAAIVISKGGGGSRSVVVAVPELDTWWGPTFSVLTPKGWTVDQGGAENRQYVDCTQGNYKVRAQDDSAGVGDIMSSVGRGERMEDHTLEVIHGVHMGKKETIAEDFGDYKEDDPVPFTCKMGMGRYSEFSGTVGMLGGTKVRGIRATVQSNTRTVIVRCVCPESAWETFKPKFIEIVKSVGPGKRA
jgi:predicted Zn finger-like uncharacterized protein